MAINYLHAGPEGVLIEPHQQERCRVSCALRAEHHVLHSPRHVSAAVLTHVTRNLLSSPTRSSILTSTFTFSEHSATSWTLTLDQGIFSIISSLKTVMSFLPIISLFSAVCIANKSWRDFQYFSPQFLPWIVHIPSHTSGHKRSPRRSYEVHWLPQLEPPQYIQLFQVKIIVIIIIIYHSLL